MNVFAQTYDVAVFGGGYAGYAAALTASQAGKNVLLIDRRGDLLAESGRCFALEAGSSDSPVWQALTDDLAARDGMRDTQVDGALAEIVGTRQLMLNDVTPLYYAAPIVAERDNGALGSILVATKTGTRRIVARQFIDATERGDLLRLCNDQITPRTPERLRFNLFYQHHDWPDVGGTTIDLSSIADGAALRIEQSLWPTERRVVIDLPGDYDRPRRAVLPALQAMFDRLGDQLTQAVLTHCSVEPLAIYGDDQPAAFELPSNVIDASPATNAGAFDTLAARFDLGVAAAKALVDHQVHEPSAALRSKPTDAIEPIDTLRADVAVAGAGTGGALAAITAARQGAKTIAVEPLAFPGGIGAGGGIHMYYFGLTGGLQSELDRRVKDIMACFGGMKQVTGFHPDAKKLALEAMLDEAGVQLITDALMFDVKTVDGEVTRMLIATPDGPVAIDAKTYIDGTGDGDLAALAGAPFVLGREGDGNLHAYSQSSGRFEIAGEGDDQHAKMRVVNYDAGWCDPTDAADLTRARLIGIRQYERDRYENVGRTTYIAPAIGLRQARQIETDYVLSLADLIERQTFDDCIGYTGAHYDNHSVEVEFESDEAVFWVWVCRQWRYKIACELPYRMLLPRGLDNVWVASRACGVSMDAHHSMRMQRDMQRIGEVAGAAAAICAASDADARHLPMDKLREQLVATGALKIDEADSDQPFADIRAPKAFLDARVSDEQIDAALEALKRGEPSGSYWWLYRAGEQAADRVKPLLTADDAMVSWLAAGIVAMWGDADAEPRLIDAIESREFGFDERTNPKTTGLNTKAELNPLTNNRLVPNWLTAISLLRRCGTDRCLPVLLALTDADALPQSVGTAIALTLERLLKADAVSDRAAAMRIIDKLSAIRPLAAYAIPQRAIGPTVQEPTEHDAAPPAGRVTADVTPHESHEWQWHLPIARVRTRLGMEPHDQARTCLDDPRAIVRRAFAQALSAPSQPATA